jgi:hypothetical protein
VKVGHAEPAGNLVPEDPRDEGRIEDVVKDGTEIEHLDAEDGARDGVPNTVANPALIPQTTIFRRSRGLSRRSEAREEARAAPIWAQGPSFPTEPPTAMVRIVAASLTGATLA